MEVRLACVVEGHGEVSAVPVLVRRIAATWDESLSVQIPRPIRTPRNKLVKPGELERAVESAARRAGPHGAVLVLIDADEDCPANLGPRLVQRATKARDDLPIGVVVAKQEYESWFLAAAESLRGRRGLAGDLRHPSNAESVRGAKEWLSKRMGKNRKYVETLDQAALTSHFDLDSAGRRSGSFDKCHREILRLLSALRTAGTE